MTSRHHRMLLRAAVALGGVVPVTAGLTGLLFGLDMLPASEAPPMLRAVALDSHYRYLSGLLLGIGLGFWSTLSRIEEQGPRFRLLTVIVVLGGLGRLLGLAVQGTPPGAMLFGLGMELVVTPLLCLWQWSVARMERE
ncbi:DUF4345 domain-containing protein [Teichococcus aestuarii]|uniref:DUF4345 domain-containing protein n=1 Tax=Teichococcus aestuarii TaxID=568898 RepID=UPI0036213C03